MGYELRGCVAAGLTPRPPLAAYYRSFARGRDYPRALRRRPCNRGVTPGPGSRTRSRLASPSNGSLNFGVSTRLLAPRRTCAIFFHLTSRRRPGSVPSWWLSWWTVRPMAPPRKRSGPGIVNRDRLTKSAPAAAAKQQDEGALVPTIRRRRLPVVHASVFAPCAGRTWWWLSYVCPHCKLGHFGRARTEGQASGPRRTRWCGRLVVVKVARVYRGVLAKEAA